MITVVEKRLDVDYYVACWLDRVGGDAVNRRVAYCFVARRLQEWGLFTADLIRAYPQYMEEKIADSVGLAIRDYDYEDYYRYKNIFYKVMECDDTEFPDNFTERKFQDLLQELYEDYTNF